LKAASDDRIAESPSAQQAPDRQPPERRGYLLRAAALVGCELVGLMAIVRAYQVAQTTLSGSSEFAWFWAGMFLLELPLVGWMAQRATPQSVRTALLILYGFVSYAPKLLRDSTAPIYYDEFAHWRETYEVLHTGKLFQKNPIVPIVAQYPGFHASTAAVVHATGLSIWQGGTLLLMILHVALVLGVAALADALFMDNRTASLIAVLYGLNSSFLYFDTQYAYESMALALAVWTLVAYVRAIRSQPGGERRAWGILTVVLSATTVVTHHLSTFTLILIMTLVALAMSVPWLAREEKWARTTATAWSLTILAALMAGAWFFLVAPKTLSYLSPYLSQGLSELMQVAQGTSSSRHLFAASLSPRWEQYSAYLVTVLAFVAAVGGLLLIRAHIKHGRLDAGRRRALLSAFVLLGLAYFPSTVFIFSPTGAQGARRSWAFTWIGLCMLTGPAAVWLIDRTARRVRRWRRVSMWSGLVAGLAIAMVGGTAAGLDASYRFPGPFLYGSDARSVTPELLGASAWFSARFGSGNNLVTDRYTGLVFASYGLQDPATPWSGFPTYDLYLAKTGSQIPSTLLSELSYSHYDYLIVDRRMEFNLPEVGIYFVPNEPAGLDVPHGGKPIFYGRLGKFDSIAWLTKVFQSGNYSVYRFDLPAARAGYDPKPPSARGKLLVTP
jgi:hypothetical protein